MFTTARSSFRLHHSLRRCLPRTALALTAVVAMGGCLDESARDANTSQVVIALSAVPDDVQCLRVTAVGTGRTVVREFEVAAAQAFSEALTGVPLGTVSFTGEAFGARCASVSRTTHPGWVSDDVAASVVLGRQSTVALSMHRNGRVKVGVDFADEPACSAVADMCQSNNECCSHNCSHGLCEAAPDGGSQDLRAATDGG